MDYITNNKFELTESQLSRAQMLFRQLAETLINTEITPLSQECIYTVTNPVAVQIRKELDDLGVSTAFFRWDEKSYSFHNCVYDGKEVNGMFCLLCAEALPSVTRIIPEILEPVTV